MTFTTLFAYRQPEIRLPFAQPFDVSADGWLWQWGSGGWLHRHHVHTAAAESFPVPIVSGDRACDLRLFEDRILVLPEGMPAYLVCDPLRHTALRQRLPEDSSVRRMIPFPDGRIALVDQRGGRLLLLDEPCGEYHAIACPWQGGPLEGGSFRSDGLLYLTASSPARVVRFDPAANRFVDEIPCRFPQAQLPGGMEYGGVLYFADAAAGRLLPLSLADQSWGEPILVPRQDGLTVHFMGQCAEFGGRGYFTVAAPAPTAGAAERTGENRQGLDRLLVFDPQSHGFEWLPAPAQPDGVSRLAAVWGNQTQLYATGVVKPYAAPGIPGPHPGDWLILQSHEAAEEPGFAVYDFAFDKKAHLDRARRRVDLGESLFIPHRYHTPAITNLEGGTAPYPAGYDQRIRRRAARTDERAVLRGILDRLIQPTWTHGDIARAVVDFVHRGTYYNPVHELANAESDAVALLAGHEIRCGGAATVVVRLLELAGVECRRVGLHHHVVAEARYDGAWHLCDAVFFGAQPPQRDGNWLSVEDLKTDPYFADAFPTPALVFFDECLRSRDDYYTLGYTMGPWGWESYYSYYLGAPFDSPPTLPLVLPPLRAGSDRVRLHWSESAKRGQGRIEYSVGIYADRAQTQLLLESATVETSLEWLVPEPNRMYFVGVRAMDDHRQQNPATWYPTARTNFVLAPPGQYGWFNVF